MSFWETIVESNTFNFAILLLIFAILYKKLNVSSMIESVKSGIIKAVENAKNAKIEADTKLKRASDKVQNLQSEIDDKLNSAKVQASGVSKQIFDNAESVMHSLELNAKKIAASEEQKIIGNISQKTLEESVQLAKEDIINRLQSNPDLHNRLIEESIEAIK